MALARAAEGANVIPELLLLGFTRYLRMGCLAGASYNLSTAYLPTSKVIGKGGSLPLS